MQKHRSIQVLRRLASPSRATDLPSWTLDFGTPLKTTGAIWALSGARFFKDSTFFLRNDEEIDAKRRGLWPCDSQAPKPHFKSGKLMVTGRLMETIIGIGPPMPATLVADQICDRFTDILAAWEELAAQVQWTKRFPQSIADAFLDTLIANDTHDVLRNTPPRPLVSLVADMAKRWYMRHGAGILRQADQESFAVLNDESHETTAPGPHYWFDEGQIWKILRQGKGNTEEFARRIARACACKRFFVTDQGSMGLAPMDARKQDVISFVPTGAFPLFLRPHVNENATTYKLLGEGFLYGWWRHIAPVFEHRIKMVGYGDMLTEFVIE